MAAFYDADLETARKNVGTALAAATTYGDVGGQIRSLTIIAGGLLHTNMYEQSLAYVENANKIAASTPDAGYQFTAQEMRIEALIGLRQLDTAQRAVDELLSAGTGGPQNWTRGDRARAHCRHRRRSK